MTTIASKFEVHRSRKLAHDPAGNDPELDPNRPAEPPTKAIDKPAPRHGKRDGSDVKAAPPAERQGNQSRAKQSNNANDNAFRDRGVGASSNRARGSGEPEQQRGGRGGRGRGSRGGARGGRGGLARQEGDRHSRTGLGEHEKQAAHGWGAETGEAELADEQAGEAIAQKEEKEAVKEDAEAEAAEPEPEDNSKSYAAYLAELAEKKLKLGEQNLRKANEGSSQNFPEGTQVKRQEEDFFAGSGGKAKRERQRKEKVHVELDSERMLAPPPREGGARGGRGGDRGGRGRGEGRGSFRGGEGRGRGGDRPARGEGRGGRGRGEGRGAPAAGPRGGARGNAPNVSDSSAFPSLGA
ncbi:elicitor protein [Stagonosporopsis vannaccii]|nr:elicitor protein [Stagonosporopsis vannaccii]